MMDGVVSLIQKSYAKDEIGQYIPSSESYVEILVTVNSVSRREWMDAGRNGMNPELMLTTAAINYSGEKEVEYEGVRYAVYRTYNPPNSDEIEIYLQRKVGVQNGNG